MWTRDAPRLLGYDSMTPESEFRDQVRASDGEFLPARALVTGGSKENE